MESLEELLNHIETKTIEENLYEGDSIGIGSRHVFGGQALAQGLNAAQKTVTNNRIAHSLHGYFILPGDLKLPVQYRVTHVRDGGSFSTRRVFAEQKGKVIFILAASFQADEFGYEHQVDMPEVKPHKSIASWDDIYRKHKDFLPQSMLDFLSVKRPIDFKPSEVNNPLDKKDYPPFSDVWFKFKGTQDLSAAQKTQLLAYVSDYNILDTAMKRHGSKINYGNTQVASLDHSIWFHRQVDLDGWMLVHSDSPSSSNARAFTRAQIFTEDGILAASVAQEGLIRPKVKP